ncbi:MAG: hypothetical protein HYU36_03200 [Planctomycetes bacterium]|nr:hypothetical protein [Planctomycetota bacterium]
MDRDEPPLSHSPLAVQYYEKMMEERRHIGRPETFNAAAHVLACPGRSTDHIYLYLHVKESVIAEARWLCHMGDPWIMIAGDIACGLLQGRRVEEILNLSLADFERVLGGPDTVIAHHTGAAALVAYKAGLDYTVKEALKSGPESRISPRALIQELGYEGRDGQLRLKRLLEGRFSAEGLQLPRARLESLCATGSVQDLSTLVQDLLEARAIDRIRAGGMGFPRSFDEARGKASPAQGPE